jgi:hypothetical protein
MSRPTSSLPPPASDDSSGDSSSSADDSLPPSIRRRLDRAASIPHAEGLFDDMEDAADDADET